MSEKTLESYEAALIHTDRSSVMLVCINGHRDSRPYGDIINCHLPKPIGFIGIHELILEIDEICEQVSAPMRSTEPRFINRTSEEQYHKLSQNKVQMDTSEKKKAVEQSISFLMNAETVVLVEVMYRQHASMQGRIHSRYSGTSYIFFRSALELMRLLIEINEAMLKKSKAD